jgi:hypothetical protein
LFLKSHPCALNEPRFGIFRPANGEIHAEYFSACRIYAYNPPDGFGVVPIGGGISLF